MTKDNQAIGPLPTWVPPLVEPIIRQLEDSYPGEEHLAILRRLALDDRMKTVWRELLKRKKGTDKYYYEAKREQYPKLSDKDDVQSAALQETFHFVFAAARDKLPVAKPAEIKATRAKTLLYVKVLRDAANDVSLVVEHKLQVPRDDSSTLLNENDVSALLRVAEWLEYVTSGLRRPDDPLMVKKHRGNPITRGVLTLVNDKLAAIFGGKLDTIAATLTSVALNLKTSTRASRSARERTQRIKARKARKNG